MRREHTVHSLSLDFIPARIAVDLELELLLRIRDLSDLVLVINEVSEFTFVSF